MILRASLMCCVLVLAGCVGFPDSLEVAEPNTLVNYQDAASKTDTVIGKQVRWGGAIAKLENKNNTTVLEMVHYPLTNYGRPKVSDESVGRFRLHVNGFLDPMVYEVGRLVTIVGQLKPIETGMVGEHEYRFPSVAVSNHYLWKKLDRVNVRPMHVWPHDLWFNPYPFGFHNPVFIRSIGHRAHGVRPVSGVQNMQRPVQAVRDTK